jgi:uncharacterized repeat protein (TIGR01451 family)
VGNFTQGQVGATYSITATNSGTAATTGATVSVSDTVPSGLTATGIAGTGWGCTQPAGPCTRSDVLGSGASYPVLTLTVNVLANAGPPLPIRLPYPAVARRTREMTQRTI